MVYLREGISAFAAFPLLPGHAVANCKSHHVTLRASAATARRPRPSPPISGDEETIVVLMRHGLTDWNCEGRVQGGLDKSRLNAIGTRQARLAGSCLRHICFDGVYVSPLSRARSTLEIVRQTSANGTLLRARPEILSSLLEIQVPWQGLLRSDIENSFCAEEYMRYLRNPMRFEFNGFSPVQDLMRRARKTWNTFRRKRGRCLLVVAHNQINRALLCDAVGLRASLNVFRQINCCFNVVLLSSDGTARIRLINSTGSGPPTTHFTARDGHVRFVLLCEGGHRGVTTVLPRGEARRRCAEVMLLNDATGEDLKPLGMLGGENGINMRRVRIGMDVKEDKMYEQLSEIVFQMRERFVNYTIICCAKEGLLLSALLTALIGMNGQRIDSFVFDGGGVTVCDVTPGNSSAGAKVFVECHNVLAFDKEKGPVFGYTRFREAVK